MAGHSKWANIKHRKEKADSKKGKVFSRIAKEIIVSVKEAGPDPRTNARLKIAIQKAKVVNMPNDIIDRNIKKASSQDQSNFDEITYELYGYGGVGLMVEAMTDNKNRLSSDIRIAINKCGGTVATPGAVAYNFDRKGVLTVPKDKVVEDDLFMEASDAGADDIDPDEESYMVLTEPEALYQVKEALEAKGIPVIEAQINFIPKMLIECNKEHQESNQKLIDWLENLDDVDEVTSNMQL